MEGTVKFFNLKKGFGFVKGDDDKDYFVHISAIQGVKFLRDNDRVSFEPGEGDRGLKAENVNLLEQGSAREEGEEPAEEAPAEEAPVEEEAPAEEPAEEEKPAEEPQEEQPAEEETPAEEPAEEPQEEEKKEE